VQERDPSGNPKNLSATYTWPGGSGASALLLCANTSEVVLGDFIKLVAHGYWYKITAINPNVSVTVEDTYGIGSYPAGSTPTARAMTTLPDSLSSSGNVDTFSRAIANAFNTEPHELPSFLKTALPPVAPAGRLIYVSDASGGAVPAFSDGFSWLRVTDRTVIS
jgi:hypothetical protein